MIIAVSLPTGQSQVSSHGYDPFIKFPWSKELGSGWSIGGMQSLFWNTDDHRRNGDWEPTFYVEKEITKSGDAFVEYAGDFTQRGGPREIAHFGTAYRITPSNKSIFTSDLAFPMRRRAASLALGTRFALTSCGADSRFLQRRKRTWAAQKNTAQIHLAVSLPSRMWCGRIPSVLSLPLIENAFAHDSRCEGTNSEPRRFR